MKPISKTILILIIVGFIGILCAPFLDNPEHFFEPDSHCPICLVSQMPMCFNPDLSVNFTLDINFFLIEQSPIVPDIFNHIANIAIRAPPLFNV